MKSADSLPSVPVLLLGNSWTSILSRERLYEDFTSLQLNEF